MVKTIAVLFLSFAGMTCAQEQKVTNEPQPQAARKRLKSVTWDLASHKLIWMIENGSLQGREFVPTSTERYEISPDEAQMQYANESRGFSELEAANLHKLLDTLAIYCAESVVWWDQGQGDEVKPTKMEERKTETVKYTRPTDSEALRWAMAQTLR